MPPTRKRKTDDSDDKDKDNSFSRSDGGDDENPVKKRGRGSSKRDSSSSEIVEASALNYFKNQQKGGKGSRNQLKKNSHLDIRLDPDEYERFRQNYLKSLKSKNSLISSSTITVLPEELANHLLWLGLSDHNILISGFGSLMKVVRDYAEEYLEGEDVLEIIGNPCPSQIVTEASVNAWTRNMRSVLSSIVHNVLKDSELSTTLTELPISSACRLISDRLNTHYGRSAERNKGSEALAVSDVGSSSTSTIKPATRSNTSSKAITAPTTASETKGKWGYNQSKLYLVVHDICGQAFHSSEAQDCLSILAACESVTMIATTSAINTSLLWNALTTYRFAWRYLRVNTFQHHPIPSDHILFLTTTTASGMMMKETTGEALIAVLRSLAKRHIEFLIAIANTYLRAKGQNQHEKYHLGTVGSYIVFSFSEAADIACEKLIIKNKGELLTLLKEFVDHNILTHEIWEKKGEYLKFLISEQDFRAVVLKFSS